MLKVLVWIVSNDDRYLEKAINILASQQNGVELVGVTADLAVQFTCDGKTVPFIPLDKVSGGEYDVILAVGARKDIFHVRMREIIQVATQLNIPKEKILGDCIACIPGFTLEKYRQLQRSQLSIFAIHCFGGLISHSLGLPFLSPFVNMFLNEEGYMHFLREPHFCLEKNLVFKDKAFNDSNGFYYPVFTLDGVELHMNHYPDFDEAVAKWNERKARINWFNLFVMAYTENENFLEQFDALPYGKKACFVPFKSNLPSAWYINPAVRKDLQTFTRIVNYFGMGSPFYYDPFDMLLYGKKTPLIDM